MLKVLIVEDDLMLADFAEELLVEHGYKVSGIARTVGDAVARIRDSAPDLVVLDLRLAAGIRPKCPARRPNCLAIWAQQAQLGSGASPGGQS
jgi:CheY-like chemotaxis protein